MIDVLASAPKAFDVLLRVHSYATQPGEVNVSLVLPRGWNVGAPVALKFLALAMNMPVQVTPPLKLPAATTKSPHRFSRSGDRAST